MEKNLGHATAYGYAKSKGYSGTEEEFAELMADYASVGQSAAQSAEQAAASATSASGSAATAAQAAQTATNKASEAVTAADTATTKASEASTSASTASSAATSAITSAQTATAKAGTATAKADAAAASEAAALSAKTDAESARDAAAQSASAAAESARTLTIDTTLTQSGQAADAKATGDAITELKNDLDENVSDLKSAVTYANEKISDLNGVIFIDVNSFEIGSAYVSNSELIYNNTTTRIRTKQGTFYRLKQGDVISMTSSGTYKYYWIYSADGTSWTIPSTIFDSHAPVTLDTTGYYMFVIMGQSSITFDDATMKTAASKLKVERNGAIAELQNRIAADEADIEANSDKIEAHTQRLFDLDGIIELPTMELGSVECIAGTGFVYTNSTIRIRTPQGVTIPVQKGDVITCSDWSGKRFYGGYKKQDNTYVQILTRASNYEMQEDGELVLCFRYEPSATITDVNALQSLFKIYRPKDDEDYVEARETLKHNDMYYTGREIRRVYNPYHDGGNLLLAGQLHCHTRYKQDGVIKYYNDGSDAIAFDNYRAARYDWMTVTNYGTIGEVHHPDAGSIPEGLVWLFDSQEAGINGTLGTSLPPKHSCVYNGIVPYDWQSPMSWQDWADLRKPTGEMVTVAHPFWDATYQPPDVLEKIKGHIRFCEVYNGEIINNGYTVETPTGKGTDYAWEAMLDKGLVTWGTAVNDAHTCTNMTRIKDGCVKVFSASKDRLSIIKNLCCGNFIACSNIDAGITGVVFADGVLTVNTGDAGASTVFLKEEGTVLATMSGTIATYTFDGTEKYVRAVITLTGGEKVWTQPIINLFSTDYDDYLELSM